MIVEITDTVSKLCQILNALIPKSIKDPNSILKINSEYPTA